MKNRKSSSIVIFLRVPITWQKEKKNIKNINNLYRINDNAKAITIAHSSTPATINNIESNVNKNYLQ